MKTTVELYMQRCLELASCGESFAAPNPLVGSVIVHDGKIIGEGYHQQYGGPHAEVNAILSVGDQELLENSTLYVNLEPCSHWGKTPPCADLIIEKRIPKVVIGMIDPFNKVCGQGIRKLKEAGIDVTVGVLEKKCMELNKKFIIFHSKKRPYITLKWAQTIDGFLDNNRKDSFPATWMTGETCKILVHRMRSNHMAIMTGTQTIIRDNPSLTVREWYGRQPLRVVIDRNLRLNNNYTVFNDSADTVIFSYFENILTNKFEGNKYIEIKKDKEGLQQIMDELYKRDIQSLLVEGGKKLLNSFISGQLWDEAEIFISPLSVRELEGGTEVLPIGIKAPEIPGTIINREIIDGTELLSVYNR